MGICEKSIRKERIRVAVLQKIKEEKENEAAIQTLEYLVILLKRKNACLAEIKRYIFLHFVNLIKANV